MNLKGLLNGFTLGEKQEVGVMSVIPLLAEKDATENLASFEDVNFLKTSSYGNMVFENHSDKPFILPSGYSIITKQLAQDHGVTFSYLLEPNSVRDINGACCIEQRQGGYIDGNGVNDFYILPLYVRKKHFEANTKERKDELQYHNDDFSRLWPIISAFQKKLVEKEEAHLVYFFNKFVDQLNQFNAEFETVKGQRGAIILLNNRIIGIEIAPTEEYWNTVWQRLIRDCYGSEVVRLAMSNLIKEFETSQELELNLDSCESIEDIEQALEDYTTAYQKDIDGRLGELLEKEVRSLSEHHFLVKSNTSNGFKHHVFKFKGEKCYGEAYTEGENIVYASILL